jgi:hypothetical protein
MKEQQNSEGFAEDYDANNNLTSTKVLMNDRRESRQFMGTPLFPNWVILFVAIVPTTVVLSFLIEGLVLRTLLTVVIAIPLWFLLRALAVKWMNHKR